MIFAALFLWQSGRIDGWPLIGGGYRAEIATLNSDLQARELAAARAGAAALAARAQMTAAADKVAGDFAVRDAARETQIQTVIRKVPIYVPTKNDSVCAVLPWGAVRLLDAAASGADPDAVRALVAPGFADDAASDVGLPEAVALLAANLGAARRNEEQLRALQAIAGN